MQKFDKQGRLLLGSWAMMRAELEKGDKVCLTYLKGNSYKLIPADDVLKNDKVCSGPITIDEKNRLIVPKTIRDGYSSYVLVYVMDSEVYLEFQEKKATEKECEKENTYVESMSEEARKAEVPPAH